MKINPIKMIGVCAAIALAQPARADLIVNGTHNGTTSGNGGQTMVYTSDPTDPTTNTASQIRIAQAGSGSGSLTVNSGSLTFSSDSWNCMIAQGSWQHVIGAVTNNGGTFHWIANGTGVWNGLTEHNLYLANGSEAGAATAYLVANAGTTILDTVGNCYVGRDLGGAGYVDINGGTVICTAPTFGLIGDVSGPSTVGVVTFGAGNGVLSLTSVTNLDADPKGAAAAYFNFSVGSGGQLQVNGYSAEAFSNLVASAAILFNGSLTSWATFQYSSNSVTGLGVLQLGAILGASTPTISPTNTVYAGTPVTLNDVTSGGTSYQWQSDDASGGASWSNIGGATTTNYVLDTTSLLGTYQYQLIVSAGGNSVTSAPVSLTVDPASAPTVLVDTTPTSASLYAGQAQTFSASFVGTLPIAYRWQYSPNADGSAAIYLAGQTNVTLVLNNLQATNSGYYSLQASNSVAPNTVNSTWAQLTVSALPQINSQPSSVQAYAGRTVRFAVTATSTPAPTYQWQVSSDNGVTFVNLANGGLGGRISGSTNSTLTFSNVAVSDTSLQFQVAVSNPGGSVISAPPASLTVYAVPALSEVGSTNILALGPVAYWPLNDVNAPVSPMYDATTNMLDGQYQSQSANLAYSIFGPQAADGYPQFEAGNGAISPLKNTADTWGIVPGLNLNTNTVTIAMWVYPNGQQSGNAGLLMDRDTTTAGGSPGGFCLDGSGNNLGYDWNDDSFTWGVSGPALPQNMWSFVALVVSPTNVSFYLYNTNGGAVTTIAHNHANMVWGGTATPDPLVRIGCDHIPGRTFNGVIDEVAVFNKSLNANQLFSLATVNPVILTEPQSQTLGVLSPAQFIVGVSSLSAVTYQWQTNGVNVSNGGVFSGATSSTLSISSIAGLNGVVFSCAVTNATGYVISAGATLTVVTPLGANEYWDINDATPGAGGAAPAGVWDTITPFWTIDSTGSSTATLWTNGNTANFSAGTDATGQFIVTVTNTGVGINNLTQTSGRIRFVGGPIALLNSSAVITATTRVSGDYDLRIDSDVTGSGAIVKQGPAILHLNGNKSFSGGIVLNAGTLALENTTANPGTGPITLNGGNLVRNWNTVTVTNTINVGGLVNVAGIQNGNDFIIAGPLLATSPSANFSVSNSAVNGFNPAVSSIKVSGDISGYTGTFTDVPGNNRLRFGPTSGSGAIVINGANAKFATYGSTSSGNPIDLPDNCYGTFKMGELSGTGGIVRGGWPTGMTTFEIGYLNTTANYAGALTDNGSGQSAVTKVGTGTLTLSGPCNYSGLTTISNGTLRINSAFLNANTNVIIAAPGNLDLNFVGTNNVKRLIIAGVTVPNGIYGSSASGAPNVDDTHFAGTGKLKVAGSTPVLPGNLSSTINGNSLSLSWPGDQGWTLQVQTNAATVGLNTNWTTLILGSSGITSTNITIDPTKPTAFYRLVYP